MIYLPSCAVVDTRLLSRAIEDPSSVTPFRHLGTTGQRVQLHVLMGSRICDRAHKA